MGAQGIRFGRFEDTLENTSNKLEELQFTSN